ncbi:adenylosuccinate synthase [Tritrichomonas foetus]|uniref:Adenylosuccinate synthetase n=1 Tax=Tritrichomonas foetus TaxID=1144522 RepID=A0A1J4KKA7_9EUKA|nr:adenylosuccinate synthase [Tritrichomonas foetus]|eukprot:OHT11659.1 adenylosuccinate synthase [Tritrichomonas foetus]
MLAHESDIVCRFQGGANAGHTIINDYGKFILHLLPSGVFNPNCTCFIGNGVALDVNEFRKELAQIEAQNVPKPKIAISERVQILMPYHKLLDQYEEERLANRQFGSTRSGIAPFYSDKYAKIGFQLWEIFDDSYFKDKLHNVLSIKNLILEHVYHKPTLNFDGIYNEVVSYRPIIEPYIVQPVEWIHQAIKDNKKILLEGQLGSLKDPDMGIYPFTTSSSPIAGFASVGASIPPYLIKDIICVVKAYSSAVGAGAFVSEIFGEEAEELRQRGGDGGEFGATTGRPRRMGWFDCVATRYGCMCQGATRVAFTVLDVLSYLDVIPVCVAYELDGQQIHEFPTTSKLDRCKPVLKELPGWKTDIRGITKYEDLPENCRKYVEFVESQIECPIKIVSNGPARADIIYRE